MSAIETIKNVKNKKIKAIDVLNSYLLKIKKEDSKFDIFLEVFENSAKEKAKQIDEKISKGQNIGKLAGSIVSIKDNMLYENHEITCASKILKGHISTYNSSVVEKLLKEDAIIIGRTNMDEFAMGSSTENSAYKMTKNPINTSYVPGGSSGGSAASVKAGFCHFSLGSDTGGSIRQPASFCGVYGFKPSYGRVSRYGLVAFSSSLDQIGPFADNTADLTLLYDTIKGYDEKDSTSSPLEINIEKKSLKGLKIALPILEDNSLENDLKNYYLEFINKLTQKGASIIKVKIDILKYALPTYYILSSSEASSNLARFDGFRYGQNLHSENLINAYKNNRGQGFGKEVKRRILLGTHSLSSGYYDAFYLKALKTKDFIKKEFEKIFNEADIIIMPTTPTAAFKFNEKLNDPISMYLSDIFTIPVNLANLCSVSFPYGKRESDSMPYGIQIIGKRFSDEMILSLLEEIKTYE